MNRVRKKWRSIWASVVVATLLFGVAIIAAGQMDSAPVDTRESTMTAEKHPVVGRTAHPDGPTEYALFAAG
jgi:hypothetical protein